MLSVGVPLRLLSARPDVRMAEKNVEVAYYIAQQAHQSFYPDITISANIGWSNGEGLVNPSKFLLEALGSIVQPLFQQGKLKARYRNAQIEQEKMRLQFVQTLLNAGNEVYRHLHMQEGRAEGDIHRRGNCGYGGGVHGNPRTDEQWHQYLP